MSGKTVPSELGGTPDGEEMVYPTHIFSGYSLGSFPNVSRGTKLGKTTPLSSGMGQDILFPSKTERLE